MIQPQTVLVPFSAFPVFDGSLGREFEFTLMGAVTSATVRNLTPGVRYTFAIAQNSVGGQTFPWPANVLGATAVHGAPSARTVRVFLCGADLRLYPVTAGTYA